MAAPLYAGIVRVSHMGTRKAGADNFHADEDQVREATTYAKELGGTIDFMPPELDISGGKPIDQRPPLRAAIEGVEQGKYAGIIVAYLSRLTRSRSGLEIWDRVEAAGGHVHCAREKLDTSTPNGRFVRDIHLANAVREREEHVDRFDTRRRLAVESGVWAGAVVPRGYVKDTDRRLVPGPDAGTITAAFRDRANGATISELARRLRMTHSGVRYMLANRTYLGVLTNGRYANLAAHPALTDQATFDACQKLQPRPPRAVGREVALLAGVIRCQGCGRVMRRQYSRGYSSYVCNTIGCPFPASITAPTVDEYVETMKARPTFAQVKMLAHSVTDASPEREAVDKARAELDTYVSAMNAAEIGGDTFAKGARVREDALRAAERALEAKTALLPARLPAETYDALTPAQRNQWLRTFLVVMVARMDGERRGRPRSIPVADRVQLIPRNQWLAHRDGEAITGMLAA